MKTLFVPDLHLVRNNPICFGWVLDNLMRTLVRYGDLPSAWGTVDPYVLLTKFTPSREHPRIVTLPPDVEALLLKMGTRWDDEAKARWIELMQGTGAISELYGEILAHLRRHHGFDTFAYWGSNGAVRRFARENGCRSFAMELGPTRYPYPDSRYCDFMGVNGDGHSRLLDLSRFEPLDVDRWLAEVTVPGAATTGNGPLVTRYAETLLNPGKPVALLALQLDDDSNCLVHSDFAGMAEVTRHVVPKLVEAGWLVLVKPHPLAAYDRSLAEDRMCNFNGHESSRLFIAENYGPKEALWVDDIAPDCYKTFLGLVDAVVTVNSSVGFEAMLLGKPTVCLGKAPYAIGSALPTLDGLCSGFDREAYDLNRRRIANVMLNHYLYPGNMLDDPRLLDFAFRRNILLEDAFASGSDALTEAVLRHPIRRNGLKPVAESVSLAGLSLELLAERQMSDRRVLEAGARADGQAAEIARLESVVQDQGQANAELQSRYDDLQARHDEMRFSTCWRLTRPVRWSLDWLKLWRRRLLPVRPPREAPAPEPCSPAKPADIACERAAKALDRVIGWSDSPKRSAGLTVDLCFVTYNSSRWLKGCVAALAASDFDLSRVGLYFADNASTDDTVEVLEKLAGEYQGRFGAFRVLPQAENRGFGAGSNAAARAGSGDLVFFCNVDTEIHPDALTRLVETVECASEDWGAFELRQFPYEHPKYYDPITLETTWSSGACLVLRRSVFDRTGGFDESIFMYAEDVDLSWRIRLEGFRIRYVPTAVLNHYAYREAGEVKPMQVIGSLVGNWVLRRKFGSAADRLRGWRKIRRQLACLPDDLRKTGDRFFAEIWRKKPLFDRFRKTHAVALADRKVAQFLGFDYAFARDGAFYENRLPVHNCPLITVVIRTYRRPEMLARSLTSLVNQTCKAFKVVVVEDGAEPVAGEVAKAFADRLDLTYLPLKENAGRCVAGNAGLAAVKTLFANFLDDDDCFFADHIEVMTRAIEDHPGERIFIAGSVVAESDRWTSGPDLTFDCLRPFALLPTGPVTDFFSGNRAPIQAVVFASDLLRLCGGFDKRLDRLEDWDLWMRYVCHTGRYTVIPKATSLFGVPSRKSLAFDREADFIRYHQAVIEKMRNYRAQISAAEIYAPIVARRIEELNLQPNMMDRPKDGLLSSAIALAALGLCEIVSVPFAILRRVLFRLADCAPATSARYRASRQRLKERLRDVKFTLIAKVKGEPCR